MKKVIVRKTHTGMPPQFYARIDVGGKERMTVLCAVAEAEAHRDPETFLHHKLVEAVLKIAAQNPRESTSQQSLSLLEAKKKWIDSLAVDGSTKNHYEYALNVFCSYHPGTKLHQIKATSSRPLIKDFVQKGKATNTIRSYLRNVQIMLKWAGQEDLIAKVPTLEQPRAEKKNIRIYSEAELDAIESTLLDHPEKNRIRFHMLLRYLGCRAGEVWSLPLRHIELDEGKIKIENVDELDWKPKGGKAAKLPIVGKLKEFLTEDLKNRDPKEKFYLDKGDGQQYAVDVSTLNTIMSRVMVRLGLGDAAKTLHGYRASAITHMLEAGINPHEVQAVVRHESLETTLGYLHQRGVSPDALAALQGHSRPFPG